MVDDGGKLRWPELLGVPATPAVVAIAYNRPDVAIEVLPPGSTVIPGHYNADRVRFFIDDSGIVNQIPEVG